jgi:hypothetical protein
VATRSRTSFQKRQKEIARQEKQRDKAARKLQRQPAPQFPDSDLLIIDENGDPVEPGAVRENPVGESPVAPPGASE